MFFNFVIGSTCQNLTFVPYVQSYLCFKAAFVSNTDEKVLQIGKAVLPKEGAPFEHPKIKFSERFKFFAAGVILMIPILNAIVHIATIALDGLFHFSYTTKQDNATFSFTFRNVLHSVPFQLEPVIKQLFDKENVAIFYRKANENTIEVRLTYGNKSSVINLEVTHDHSSRSISEMFFKQFVKDRLDQLNPLIDKATTKDDIKKQFDEINAEVLKICGDYGAPDLLNLKFDGTKILYNETGIICVHDALPVAFDNIKTVLTEALLKFLSKGRIYAF